MTDKGQKVLRRSPRKKGRKCGRPFTAPRTVTQSVRNSRQNPLAEETKDSDVQLMTDSEVKNIVNVVKTMEDNQNSEVQLVTETEHDRKITARQELLP
jgi:hypothetical protein